MHEMGKKFNDAVKLVGKKFTLSEKYIPLGQGPRVTTVVCTVLTLTLNFTSLTSKISKIKRKN